MFLGVYKKITSTYGFYTQNGFTDLLQVAMTIPDQGKGRPKFVARM